jgi:hypothetical protein
VSFDAFQSWPVSPIHPTAYGLDLKQLSNALACLINEAECCIHFGNDTVQVFPKTEDRRFILDVLDLDDDIVEVQIFPPPNVIAEPHAFATAICNLCSVGAYIYIAATDVCVTISVETPETTGRMTFPSQGVNGFQKCCIPAANVRSYFAVLRRMKEPLGSGLKVSVCGRIVQFVCGGNSRALELFISTVDDV